MEKTPTKKYYEVKVRYPSNMISETDVIEVSSEDSREMIEAVAQHLAEKMVFAEGRCSFTYRELRF